MPTLRRVSRKCLRSMRKICLLAGAVACYFLLTFVGWSTLWSGWPAPQGADLRLDGSHPIDDLIAHGHTRWQAKLARQSSTLEEAVAEYRRRYGRPPPKGFDDWHAVATVNRFVLIDEFDAIDEDLSLFRLLSSAELRKRAQKALRQEVANAIMTEDGLSWLGRGRFVGTIKWAPPVGFSRMLSPNAHKLPSMTFPMSSLTRSLVVPPWEKTQLHNLTLQLQDGPFLAAHNASTMWNKFSKSCHPSSPVRQRPERFQWPVQTAIGPRQVGIMASRSSQYIRPQGVLQLPQMQFLAQTEAHDDMCSASPDRFYEHDSMHSSWPAFSEVFPLFSPGKGPGAIDIRTPSSHMYEATPGYTYGYEAATGAVYPRNPLDPSWEDKADSIYWRGSLVGGDGEPSAQELHFPRHRLVQLAVQPSNLSIPLVRRSADGVYEATLTPVEDLRHAIDVAFTSSKQCSVYPGKCDQMKIDYKFVDPVPLDDAFRAKMIFDIDGMGYSARFPALLSSRSAVVKATVYREFHDDWLEPWVHYIPASTHYQELFNIWAYFLGDATPKGDAALRKIADNSRHAKFTQLRPVDLEDVYRLALEWARLWYKDYEDMDYHPGT